MRMHWRTGLLLGVGFLVVTGFLALPPIPQPESYHDFAADRTWLGIPNFPDVASNLAFVVVGVLGVIWVGRHPHRFREARQSWPYLAFFSAVILVGIGSGYYHWAPDHGRLFWDRLAMSLAFMAILAAIMSDRLADQRIMVVLPVLLVFGAMGAIHWYWTELQGAGDLRLYMLTQALPLVLGMLLVLLHPGAYTRDADLLVAAGWYLLALAADRLDHPIHELTGGVLSGHTLKHLLAALSVYWVLRMLRRRRWRPFRPAPDQ
ncbi:alkaline phytoceramidase [Ectothiorhodospira shaposhnikovii]|uniref:alkaline phytoceramidase n=1 Tax=Ectothiorhodospira shaposhnikovii TaxID=1054 RepID=UPI001EE9323E|nr:alkaline phytoceramidase [Ectothiorhodospira shaposhnikovii]MCG5512715.1 alkaline phytoceramidase [Ectothiorhodospira shaposhnikovii]